MRASVFVGTSVDGFIARPDGVFDFLPADGGEPHGYEEFMATVDALVMGRNTYEVVLAFDEWPYGKKPVFVLSTRPLPPAPAGAVGEHLSGDPVDIVSRLSGTWHSAHLRRRRGDGPALHPRESGSTPHHHARAGAHRHRHSALRRRALRHPAQAHRDEAICQRVVQREYEVLSA